MPTLTEISYPFVDPAGRPSDKPTNQESGISDNPNLFLGEMALMLAELGELTHEHIEFIDRSFNDVEVVPGLYRRQPPALQEDFRIPYHVASHDERNGFAMAATTSPNLWHHVNSIVLYGEEYDWQFNDLTPRSNFFRALKESPLSTIKKLIAYIKDLRSNPQDTNGVDIRHSGDIVALAAIAQPRDRAFLRIVADKPPGLLSLLWLAIAMVLSTRSTIVDGSRGGTILMAWFRNVALQRLDLKGLSKRVLGLAISLFNKRMVKKYGVRYPEVLANAYWDRIGTISGQTFRHPMIRLVGRRLDLKGY